MSEPARKRRMFGHPQWGQTPSLSSQSFSGSEFTFTSDATTGTSYSADSSTFPNVDPFPTDTLPLDVFSYDYPIVTAQGLPVTEAAPLPFDSISPLLHLHSDAQTQFSGPSNASLDPSLPTQHEVWQNHQGPPDAPLPTEEPNYDIDVSSTLPLDDIWRNTSLYRLDGGMSFESRPVVSTSDIWSRKRDFDRVSDGLGSTAVSQTTNDLLRAALPSLFPSLPDIRSRQARSFVANPFLDCLENSYPTLANRVRPVIPENGVINGYIKIRLCSVQEDETNAAVARVPFFRSQRREAAITPDDGGPLAAAIPLLPPNFSTGMKLDRTDEKLWCFHINAYCPGRTLLPGNFWCDQVAAVAVKSECARHALLAFTTTYILDYEPTKVMEKRAKHHYRKAVQLLDEALKREETYSVGHDDGVVVAIILIISNDIVNWESRRPPGIEPLWREGARAARLVLDRADPGYRYWNPQNVQSSLARIGGANWIASTEICAQPVAPLSEEQTTNLFPWLLEGSKEDIHKIQGVTGVCPKLLHIFSQITHLAALLKKDPDSTIVPLAALKVRNRLAKFWQWSDDSFVYSSGDELMKSCVLDEDGKVNDPAMVTALSAYAWVPAAEMYLHMRVYRKPRSHAHVVRSLKRLVMCIERLPCTGPLFTSQSPFFPVFLMAVAAVQDEDRKVVRDWFEVVLNGASCRSNVPPVWTAIKNLWKWLDNDLKEEPYDEDQPIGDRRAWWEEMVDELVRVNGILSLV